MSEQWTPEVKTKLQSILSITRPRAGHSYHCVWCSNAINRGHKYVRVVWQERSGLKHSDHICADCWDVKTAQPSKEE